MQTEETPTIPADPFEAVEPASGIRMTPLARAALDNGVSFEDVSAYLASRNRTPGPTTEALAIGLLFKLRRLEEE